MLTVEAAAASGSGGPLAPVRRGVELPRPAPPLSAMDAFPINELDDDDLDLGTLDEDLTEDDLEDEDLDDDLAVDDDDLLDDDALDTDLDEDF